MNKNFVHQVGDQPRLYYDAARSTNHQEHKINIRTGPHLVCQYLVSLKACHNFQYAGGRGGGDKKSLPVKRILN